MQVAAFLLEPRFSWDAAGLPLRLCCFHGDDGRVRLVRPEPGRPSTLRLEIREAGNAGVFATPYGPAGCSLVWQEGRAVLEHWRPRTWVTPLSVLLLPAVDALSPVAAWTALGR